MIRVAAMADVHFGIESAGSLKPLLEDIEERADVLLMAGDLTRVGDPEEARVLVEEVGGLPVPVVAVLGNHDLHLSRQRDVASVITDAGIRLLEGDATTIRVNDATLAVAGVKGYGGGFVGACASEFGEPEMKAFVAHSRSRADALERALMGIAGDVRVALVHYSPVPDTLEGERREIYPFLGSYFLAEAVDRAGADLVVHGHAHAGTERGTTPGGVPVRNVAMPVIGAAYRVYCFGDSDACVDESSRVAPALR